MCFARVCAYFLYMWCGVKRRGLTDGGCVVDVLYVVFVFLLCEAFPPFALFGTEVLGGRVGAFDDEGAAGFKALHDIGAHVVGPYGEVGHIVGRATLLSCEVIYGCPRSVARGAYVGECIGASATEGREAVGLDKEGGAAGYNVEGVTGERTAFPFTTAIAESTGTFLAGFQWREIKLWTTVFKGGAIWHARVFVEEETEAIGRGYKGRTGEAGEGRDEKGILRSWLVGGFVNCQLL